MASYSFSKEGKAVPLAQIDDIVCAKMGEEAHPEKFSTSYRFIVMIGMSASMRTGVVDPVALEEILADSQTEESDKQIVRDMLINEYTFESWR